MRAPRIAGQYTRLLRRRTHEHPDGDGLIESANAAALDTVCVAVEGYATAPRSETVLFNILAGFLGSFATVRLSTWAIRDGRGPFRNVRVGGRHIHHFVPGILIAFAAGTTALLTDERPAGGPPRGPDGGRDGAHLRRGRAAPRPP